MFVYIDLTAEICKGAKIDNHKHRMYMKFSAKYC